MTVKRIHGRKADGQHLYRKTLGIFKSFFLSLKTAGCSVIISTTEKKTTPSSVCDFISTLWNDVVRASRKNV